jgi:hypothetical protein
MNARTFHTLTIHRSATADSRIAFNSAARSAGLFQLSKAKLLTHVFTNFNGLALEIIITAG